MAEPPTLPVDAKEPGETVSRAASTAPPPAPPPKSPSLEEGEVPEDGEVTTPQPPPRPSAAPLSHDRPLSGARSSSGGGALSHKSSSMSPTNIRSPPTAPRAHYGPHRRESGPLAPQEHAWGREREAQRMREHRERHELRDRDLHRPREWPRDRDPRDRDRMPVGDRDRIPQRDGLKDRNRSNESSNRDREPVQQQQQQRPSEPPREPSSQRSQSQQRQQSPAPSSGPPPRDPTPAAQPPTVPAKMREEPRPDAQRPSQPPILSEQQAVRDIQDAFMRQDRVAQEQDRVQRERDAKLQQEREIEARERERLRVAQEQDLALQRARAEQEAQMRLDREREAELDRERQLQQEQRQPSPAQEAAPEESRTLDVHDALSYLDMVKVQFQDQPDIYNKFLDTMKQFKSEMIDTPGVIDRVSELFAGHQRLIQGFNAFLPQGYRIEASSSIITVITPSGKRTQQAAHAPPAPSTAQSSQQPTPLSAQNMFGGVTPRTVHREPAQQQPVERDRTREREQDERNLPMAVKTEADWRSLPQSMLEPPHQFGPASAGIPIGAVQVPPVQQQHPQHAPVPVVQPHAPPPPPPEVHPAPVQQTTPPFNDAMDYVNRIKQRFEHEPQVYRRFLDILQTFQRNNGSADATPMVFQQIVELFQGQEDLIEEFRRFVNYTGDTVSSGGGMDENMDSGPDRGGGGGRKKRTDVKRKRAVYERENIEAAVVPVATRPQKKMRMEKVDIVPQDGPWDPSPPALLPESNIRGQPPTPAALPTHGSSFFARLGDQEFTKLARAFAAGDRSVSLRSLVERLGPLDGHGPQHPLASEFRDLVGWHQFILADMALQQHGREREPMVGAGVWTQAILVEEPALGPSYRRLPPGVTGGSMHGRDEMCRSVLNDELVSHPSWAPGYNLSDEELEAGTNTRYEKNVYERALQHSEDERHELDFFLEALGRICVALEGAQTRLAALPPEERSAYRFKLPNLSNQLKPGFLRVLSRVYGVQPAADVVTALHDNPSVAVDVVHRRLRKVEEEWKRTQRSWNRVLRVVEAQNIFQSWDHEGAISRSRDAALVRPATIVTQLVEARQERLKAVAAVADVSKRGAVYAKPDWSAELEYPEIMQDALKLLFAFLDALPPASSGGASMIEGFLRVFVPLLVSGDANAWDRELGGSDDGDEERKRRSSKAKTKKPSTLSSGPVIIPDSNGLQLTNGDPTPAPSTPSPVINSGELTNRRHVPVGQSVTFFANQKLFVFIRIFEVLAARLTHFAHIAHTLAHSSGSYLDHPLAMQLGLPRTVPPLVEAYGPGAGRFYNALLEAIEALFAGEMSEGRFQETARSMFGFEAAKLLSIDRLVGAVVKHAEVVLSDKPSRALVGLFHQQRAAILAGSPLAGREEYRRAVAEQCGNESVVLVTLADSKINAQLIRTEDHLPQDAGQVSQRHAVYLEAYARKGRTPNVHPTKLPFLNRNLPSSPNAWKRDKSRLMSKRGLQATIDPWSCQMMITGEEILARRWTASELEAAKRRAAAREEQANAALDKLSPPNP